MGRAFLLFIKQYYVAGTQKNRLDDCEHIKQLFELVDTVAYDDNYNSTMLTVYFIWDTKKIQMLSF